MRRRHLTYKHHFFGRGIAQARYHRIIRSYWSRRRQWHSSETWQKNLFLSALSEKWINEGFVSTYLADFSILSVTFSSSLMKLKSNSSSLITGCTKWILSSSFMNSLSSLKGPSVSFGFGVTCGGSLQVQNQKRQ